MTATPANGISRTFRDLSDKDLTEVQSASVLARWTGMYGFSWEDLLTARRILIVSEAGVGKTHECRACQQRLWAKGEPAFFLELATLADTAVADMLVPEERERLEAWLRAQSETATFFLDSIDELRISQKSFEQALKRLSSAIAGHLNRARVVITTRPIPLDQRLIEQHLPIPPASTAEATAESFADMAMRRDRREKDDKAPKLWRNVGLLPLTTEQIRAFAILQGVSDADALLADIERRHAEEYAQRPQDLIELCSDWKDHHRIRKHAEQVAANIANKLRARTDRAEKAELAEEVAFEGASRLALAALLTRKLIIRYSAESDNVQAADAALDAGKVLTNWPQANRDALLERGLFGFANYGRVRFHHRSVIEYLAAKRLDALLQRGTPIKAVKRILFAETMQRESVVRPSMRPVAAWLSLWRAEIFSEVLRREPEILLIHSDPQSLSSTQRSDVLKVYVARYGSSGWRGLRVPPVQVHRFASPDLASTVKHIWVGGVQNPEIRELLCELIGAGKLTTCADIAYALVMDKKASLGDRVGALDALIALSDSRLRKVAASIEKKPPLWPTSLATPATLRLFPTHLNVKQLSSILKTIQEPKRAPGDLSWRLPQLIDEGALTSAVLDELRIGLTALVLDGVEWRPTDWPYTHTKRADLIPPLMAACNRQFREGVRTRELFRSSVIAIRLAADQRNDDDGAKALHANLASATGDEREQAFLDDHALLETLKPMKDASNRVFALSDHGGIHLNAGKDRDWVVRRLADKSGPIAEREMMLWAAMIEVRNDGEPHLQALQALKPYVADAAPLLAIIENRLKQTGENEMRRLESQIRRDKRKAENRNADAHASWVKFWKEVAESPDVVFADDRAENTAWYLWQTMERSGSESRAAGWNRRFIEQQFGQAVAERLRSTLLRMWRKDKPTLRSERPADQKNSFLVRWQLGLAAIYAEAEDPHWASKLTPDEAQLAARYAPIELSGFPSWFEALVAAHSSAIDAVLGSELSGSLREGDNDNDATIWLQNIRHAAPRVAALFMPRIKAWLKEACIQRPDTTDLIVTRIGQVIDVLMLSDDATVRKELEMTAAKSLAAGLMSPPAHVWLPVLMQLNPQAGVAILETGLKSVRPSNGAQGARWFATLFDRDHRGTIDLRRPEFSPKLLLRLVRLAYKHVRRTDDAHHEGTYTPNERDHAERGREAVLSALLATTGAEGWQAKLEMAADPLFAHFKDRAIAVARERAAEEVDGVALREAEIVALDTYGELPPPTRDAMFAIMRDRLDDIEDLLLQDVSPRELWSIITDERVMRRALARELLNSANHMYTVDQEGATADEKETDIRMRTTRSDQQAVIELKIGDKPRPASELRAALKDQLLNKYMAADTCRAGCLVITVHSNKTWSHPDKKRRLDFSGLLALLSDEADRLSLELAGTVRLMVKGLDLRPRLSTERQAKAAKKKRATRTRTSATQSKANVGRNKSRKTKPKRTRLRNSLSTR